MKMKIISDIGSLFYMNYNVHNQINYLFSILYCFTYNIFAFPYNIQKQLKYHPNLPNIFYFGYRCSKIVLLTISSHFGGKIKGAK